MRCIVAIGDIISSRGIGDRVGVQSRLATVLDRLNAEPPVPLSPYTITLGDEFQAVFDHADRAFGDAIAILAALYPHKVRFSFGAGEIVTPINPRLAIGMDGPAFHSAHDDIERLKRSSSLFTVSGIDGALAPVVLHSLSLVSHAIPTWNHNRLRTLALLLRGMSVAAIARELGLSVKTIYKTIDVGALHTIVDLFADATNALNEGLQTP